MYYAHFKCNLCGHQRSIEVDVSFDIIEGKAFEISNKISIHMCNPEADPRDRNFGELTFIGITKSPTLHIGRSI